VFFLFYAFVLRFSSGFIGNTTNISYHGRPARWSFLFWPIVPYDFTCIVFMASKVLLLLKVDDDIRSRFPVTMVTKLQTGCRQGEVLIRGWELRRKQEIRSVELAVCPMQLFHFWSRDVHPVQNLLLCTKFHQNRMIFTARQYTDARLTRDIDIANLSVCPSVRPSVTFRYHMKTA